MNGRRFIPGALRWLLLAAVAVAAIRAQSLPSAETLGAAGFSTPRALEHLQHIASRPRPSGSAAHADVRTYLQRTLINLGGELRTTTANGTRRSGGTVEIHNIAARFRGTASGGSVLLVCHYDSVADGCGAGDDGAACAALLTTLEILAKEPRPKNDLVALFTDGEELGLLGARAFASADNDWFRDAKVVFNFEGRGSSGPAWMFETGPRSSRWVRLWLSVAPAPLGYSLMALVYRVMPNDTDFTIFRRAGLPGLNFALIGDYENYHRPSDDVARLDRRSLAHHGSSMLALARAAGSADLDALARGEDATYFQFSNRIAVYYLTGAGSWYAVAALAFFCIALWRGLRRQTLEPTRALAAVVTIGSCVAGTAALGFGLCQLILLFDGEQRYFPMGFSRHDGWWLGLLTALVALVASSCGRVTSRRFGFHNCIFAFLAIFAAGAATSALFASEAAYLFVWPLLLCSVASLPMIHGGPRWPFFAAALCVIALFAPVIWLFYQGMMLGLAAAATPLLFVALFPFELGANVIVPPQRP